LTGLTSKRRLKRSQAKRNGLALGMVLENDTRTLQISVSRKAKGKFKVVFTTTITPTATGSIEFRLRDSALRRALKTGLYEIDATPGRSAADMGVTASVNTRVVNG